MFIGSQEPSYQSFAKRLRRGLTGSAAIIAGTVMAVAVPQSAIAQEADEEIEEVVVTGSRLSVNENLSSPSPVLSVGQEEIDIRGNVRIEDLTNVLPQVFAGQAGEVSNGASGTATLNLRGLGANRTLVLVDGKRLPFGASGISAANLDLIPTQLVERVDVLTGGASAVYGSDAVAGVANFILKRDFEGIDFEIQGAGAQSGNDRDTFEQVLIAGDQPVPDGSFDGEELFLALTIGANSADGRGNVTLFGSYETRRAISQADRTISACALGSDSGPQSFEGFGCVGSANFRLFGGPGGFGFQELDGTVIPFAGGPSQTFNFGPFNFFQRPSERFQIVTRGHYDLTDNIEAFADLSFTNNSSDAQIAPTASFGIGAFSINCDNPFIQGGSGPAGTGIALTDTFGCDAAAIAAGDVVDGISASHRNVEGGPRNSFLDNTAWRLVGGFRGDLNEATSFELFAQFARTEDLSVSTNDFVVANVQQAFFAVDDGAGNVVCQDQSGGCVPFNPFQRTAAGDSLIFQDQLDFIQGVGLVSGQTEQQLIGGHLQFDLGQYGIKTGASDSGVALLVGAEYREDSLASNPDEISQVEGGGFTGVGGATLAVAGSIEVFELFTEIEVPLVTGQPGFEELTIRGQYRYSDYETDGNGVGNSFDTNTFSGGISWVPVEDITIRAQFQRAVRAPNVIELFTGQNIGLANLNSAGDNVNGVQLFDPCASDAPIATAAACANTGVTAAQFGTILDVISGQTQVITGGNPLLDPEESDTITAGVVITPRGVPGLSLSFDYFNIEVDEFVSAGVGAQTTLDNCLATGDSAFCDLITRSPAGSLAAGGAGFGFLSTNLNIASLETSGIDAQIQYGFDVGDAGQIRFDYAATYLLDFGFTPFPGGDTIECAGNFGNSCFQPVNPEYRHRLLATWDTGNLSTSITWRLASSTTNESDVAPEIDDSFGTVNYVDLSVNYGITDTTSVRGGITNVFDQNAPVSISAGPALGNGNTFPTIFDTGRFFFLGFTVSL